MLSRNLKTIFLFVGLLPFFSGATWAADEIRDYYLLLGLNPNQKFFEKKALEKLATEIISKKGFSIELASNLAKAVETLSDPTLRKYYDDKLKQFNESSNRDQIIQQHYADEKLRYHLVKENRELVNDMVEFAKHVKSSHARRLARAQSYHPTDETFAPSPMELEPDHEARLRLLSENDTMIEFFRRRPSLAEALEYASALQNIPDEATLIRKRLPPREGMYRMLALSPYDLRGCISKAPLLKEAIITSLRYMAGKVQSEEDVHLVMGGISSEFIKNWIEMLKQEKRNDKPLFNDVQLSHFNKIHEMVRFTNFIPKKSAAVIIQEYVADQKLALPVAPLKVIAKKTASLDSIEFGEYVATGPVEEILDELHRRLREVSKSEMTPDQVTEKISEHLRSLIERDRKVIAILEKNSGTKLYRLFSASAGCWYQMRKLAVPRSES